MEEEGVVEQAVEPKVVEEPIVYRFLGDGTEYHSGIPARHLNAFDVGQMDPERQLVLSASPLYEKVEAPEAAGAEPEEVPRKSGKKGGA